VPLAQQMDNYAIERINMTKLFAILANNFKAGKIMQQYSEGLHRTLI
jgi:hypothetical protein